MFHTGGAYLLDSILVSHHLLINANWLINTN